MADGQEEFHPYLTDKPAGDPYGQSPFKLSSEGVNRFFSIRDGITVRSYDWGTAEESSDDNAYDWSMTGFAMKPVMGGANLSAFDAILKQEFSLSFWFRQNKNLLTADGGATQYIAEWNANGGHQNRIYYSIADGKFQSLTQGTKVGGGTANVLHKTSSAVFNSADGDRDHFQHLVISYDINSIPTFYQNGSLLTNAAPTNSNLFHLPAVDYNTTGADHNGTESLSLGGYLGGGSNHWPVGENNINNLYGVSGLIDEVSLWTGQLTLEQVSGIYNTGTTGNPEFVDLKSLSFGEQLSGWWRFGASGLGTGAHNLASDNRNLDFIITGNSGYYAANDARNGGLSVNSEYGPTPWSTYL